jgi:sugar fermentation stimulation protein A
VKVVTMTVHLPFEEKLVAARFRSRPNRFLVEAEQGGRMVEAHLHDPGRLRELLVPGAELRLAPVSPARRSERKTAWTVALVKAGNEWVSVDSGLPNRFVEKCLREGALFEFRDYAVARREMPFGRSRFDFHLVGSGMDILLEVKSVTLVEDGLARFPDAPTLRGTRHLRELAAASSRGYAGTVLFLVQRSDVHSLMPHWIMDSAFAHALAEVYRQGVEVLAYTTSLTPRGMTLGRRIPVRLEPPAGEAP